MMAAASQLVADCFHNRDNRERREKPALVAIVFKILPKIHPKKNQACQPQKTAQVAAQKESTGRVTGLNVTREKKGLLQLPKGGLRIPLPCVSDAGFFQLQTQLLPTR